MLLLKEMLKYLMERVREKHEAVLLPVEGSSINPPPPLIHQTSMPQREMYAGGGLSSKLARTLIKKFKNHPEVKKIDKEIEKHQKWIDEGGPESQRNQAMETYGTSESDLNYRDLAEMSDEFAEMELSMLHQEKIQILKDLEAEEVIGEIERNPYPNREDFQEGGELDAQMTDMMSPEEIEATQLPDEEMEEDYVEFIMSEALEPEEQQYLTDRLVEDDQLSMIFDKVVETASEFSGSGSVEGPGTGISDSIPARLSDGEFVMTAKATDTIGADTLQELMSLAEQEAETGRQAKAIGGEATSVEVEKLSSTVIEEDPIKLKNKEAMRSLDPRLSLFAS